MKIKHILNRIYADYIMNNRYEEYYDLLNTFYKKGFKFITLNQFYHNEFCENDKIILLRHDIDTDLNIAKKMFEIENIFNIKSTYYFRLSTIDLNFMKNLEDKHCEVGYHFEELATFAKTHRLKDKEDVIKNIDSIKNDLKLNIENFKSLGFNLCSISSHGDWMNRKLNMRNLEIIDDNILNEYNIFEAYSIEEKLDCRLADNPYPIFWVGGNPMDITCKGYKYNLLLLHPRNWNSSFKTRLKEDINRIMHK